MIQWKVLEWMTKSLSKEKMLEDTGEQNDANKLASPVTKTLVSMTLRHQTFLDMAVDDKIEWLERKITHRERYTQTAGSTSQELWKRLVKNSTKDGCEAVRDVIQYTKNLVSSVKQFMRVQWLDAKKHFPEEPEAYHDIIPYPSDPKYDPMANPYEVDDELFVEGEDDHGEAVWGYLLKAREGYYDAQLIACYGAAGVQWPALKCDGTNSLDSYPQALRKSLAVITAKLDAAKQRQKAEDAAKKKQAELDRPDKIRVKVTINAALSDHDYKAMPLYISPGWHKFPVPTTEKGWQLEATKSGKNTGEGKVEFDDVPLGKQSFVIYMTNNAGDKKPTIVTDSDGVATKVAFKLAEADAETGLVIDISEYVQNSNISVDCGNAEDDYDAEGDDAEGDDAEGDDAEGDASADGDDSQESDAEREKDSNFDPDRDAKPQKGAPKKAHRCTRTHAHRIDCSAPFPIDPSNPT